MRLARLASKVDNSWWALNETASEIDFEKTMERVDFFEESCVGREDFLENLSSPESVSWDGFLKISWLFQINCIPA